jgi:hypothetical protein
VRSLTALTRAVLQTAAIRPIGGTASLFPTPRSIRFYVARGLMDRPEGKGPAATYGYRHFLQILTVKLRQMEGANLDQIKHELSSLAGDVIERKLAATLDSSLPHPGELDLDPAASEGRFGHALNQWRIKPNPKPTASVFARWHRVDVGHGIELHVHEGHPLADALDNAPAVADAVRRALRQFHPPST